MAGGNYHLVPYDTSATITAGFWTDNSGWTRTGSHAGWTGGLTGQAGLAAATYDYPAQDGDSSYISATASGATVSMGLKIPGATTDAVISALTFGVLCRVTAGSAPLDLVLTRQHYGLTIKTLAPGTFYYTEYAAEHSSTVIASLNITATGYATSSVDLITSPFGGSMPRMTDRLFGLVPPSTNWYDPNDPQLFFYFTEWALRLRLRDAVSGGGQIRVSQIYADASLESVPVQYVNDFGTLRDSVEVYTLKEVTDSGRLTDTAEGATLKEVTDSGHPRDVASKAITFRNARSTSGTPPNQHSGTKPVQE